jgi:hypothetical protein
MEFDVIGDITGIQTIATGSGIRELGRLRKRYGPGRWRKRKGFAEIRLPSGEIVPRYTGMRPLASAGAK